MSKDINQFTYVHLPKPVDYASGMKVSWRLYDNLRTAQLAALAARHNGHYRMQEGFDSGYLSPGSISQIGAKNRYDKPEYDGYYEVVEL